MRAFLSCLGATVLVTSIALGCDFRYDPASLPQYYRATGWQLPGTTDFNPSAAPNAYGAPPVGLIPEAVARLLPHDDDPYIVRFPAQVFELDGVRKRMRPLLAKATVVRVEVNGKTVAYSYGLIPISAAHKEKGKWVVKGEEGCIFYATYIDDKGDGVFRVLVPGPFTPDMVPAWAKQPRS